MDDPLDMPRFAKPFIHTLRELNMGCCVYAKKLKEITNVSLWNFAAAFNAYENRMEKAILCAPACIVFELCRFPPLTHTGCTRVSITT